MRANPADQCDIALALLSYISANAESGGYVRIL